MQTAIKKCVFSVQCVRCQTHILHSFVSPLICTYTTDSTAQTNSILNCFQSNYVFLFTSTTSNYFRKRKTNNKIGSNLSIATDTDTYSIHICFLNWIEKTTGTKREKNRTKMAKNKSKYYSPIHTNENNNNNNIILIIIMKKTRIQLTLDNSIWLNSNNNSQSSTNSNNNSSKHREKKWIRLHTMFSAMTIDFALNVINTRTQIYI